MAKKEISAKKKTTTRTAVSKKSSTKRLVLLDAHAILHRAYHALPDFSSPKGEPTGALYGVVAMLLKIVEELQPDYVVACYDLPEPTYRHEVFDGYKATRTKTDDDLIEQIERSRDVFSVFGVPIYEHSGFEADDILGTIVEKLKKDKSVETIIASGDMDTLQLVDNKKVQVYTLRKGIKDTVMYDEKAVEERYGFGPLLIPDYKGLRGDPSDNIPGVAGIGEKTATELVTQFGGIETIYKKLKKDEDAFTKAGVKPRIVTLLKENEEEAEFSKMLATIRRDAPITFSLPKKTWRDALTVEPILDLFSEFGFRTLSTRVRTLFGAPVGDLEDGEETEEDVDVTDVAQTAVALWILHSDITNATVDDIVDYGRSVARATSYEESKDVIFKELKESGLQHIYDEIEYPLISVLRTMEKVGIKLDTTYLGRLSKKMHTELSRIEKRIHTYAGEDFNINSPKQLSVVLYDTLGLKPKNQKRTATGQRSTKESELEKLRDEHPIIGDLLRYRELQKLLSTYIDNLPAMVGSDGRLHTTFVQTGAVTGRMASQNPNLQNIPIRSEEGRAIRNAFVADRGYRIVALDYSQIELRIAAILSGDKKLIDIFKRGEDVHQGVAVRVFGVSANEVDYEMRRRAKVINFGILYGMGVNALRQNLGEDTPRKEAQEFLNAYFHTFTTLAEYLEDTKAHARKYGYTETLFGRRRYFEGITSHVPFIRAAAERMAINAPIQGTSADVTRIAMVRIHEYLKKEDLLLSVRMLLQVHDELVFEIQESKIKTIVPKLKEIMESVVPKEKSHGVPIVAEVSVGKNWGELEKLKMKN